MINERDVFLNTNDFAETVTFTPYGGESVALKGLWYAPGTTVTMGDIDVVVNDYVIELASEEVKDAGINSTVEKDGVTYYAVEFMPDGYGFTKIKLSKEEV